MASGIRPLFSIFNSVSDVMNDRRTRRNIQHDMTNLLRQSVYSRLAGYEDVNVAQLCFISVRKPQEDEIGMFIAHKKWKCGSCSGVNINCARMDIYC